MPVQEGDAVGPGPISKALRALPELPLEDGAGPRLGDVLDLFGARMHGTAILLLALPESLPLPLPSVGAVLGVPLIAVSAHLAVYGEAGTLPRRALDWRMPQRAARILADRVAPLFERAEGWSRARLLAVAGKERSAGLACLFLSAILFLPIPFANIPAAIGLVILAWGLIQKDGAILGVGLGYAAAIAVGLAVLSAAVLERMG